MNNFFYLVIIFFLSNGVLFSQDYTTKTQTSSVSFGFTIIGANGMTQNGLSELNSIFIENSITPISEFYQSIGVSIRFFNKKRINGIEVNSERMTTFLPNSNDVSSSTLLPRISGRTLKVKYLRRYLDYRRWFGTWEIGLSATALTLNIIETKAHTSSFRNLLGNPSLASTLNLTQREFDQGIDGAISIFYRTNGFKKICSELIYGFRMGYYQPLYRGTAWAEFGTGNNFVNGDLPMVKLDNFYVQFSIHLSYDFMQGKSFKSKKK